MKKILLVTVMLSIAIPAAAFGRGGGMGGMGSHHSSVTGGAFGSSPTAPGTNSLGTYVRASSNAVTRSASGTQPSGARVVDSTLASPGASCLMSAASARDVVSASAPAHAGSSRCTARSAPIARHERSGLTVELACSLAGFTADDGAWKRVSDLQRDGLVADTGLRALGSAGRLVRVLRITDAGRARAA